MAPGFENDSGAFFFNCGHCVRIIKMKNGALILMLIAVCSGHTASCSEPTEALFAEAPGTLLNTTVAERGWSSGWKADSEYIPAIRSLLTNCV
jgi:hypothetical protein